MSESLVFANLDFTFSQGVHTARGSSGFWKVIQTSLPNKELRFNVHFHPYSIFKKNRYLGGYRLERDAKNRCRMGEKCNPYNLTL